MILDAILSILTGFASFVLSPLGVISFGIDLVNSIPEPVYEFFNVIFYILPWKNLLPIITIIISVIVFKITVAIIKLVMKFIPFF